MALPAALPNQIYFHEAHTFHTCIIAPALYTRTGPRHRAFVKETRCRDSKPKHIYFRKRITHRLPAVGAHPRRHATGEMGSRDGPSCPNVELQSRLGPCSHKKGRNHSPRAKRHFAGARRIDKPRLSIQYLGGDAQRGLRYFQSLAAPPAGLGHAVRLLLPRSASLPQSCNPLHRQRP